ncbi:terminase large subunit [Lacrimispora amygdalina]|uniref:Terminase large subunit n=1 Tax=Lacrimispora amygdalina TaxID=253257 RepID=A0A3E2NCT9_9FIRM|nr:terminase TerL endonuclease subunit [Clostridium indicum]RFZ78783.1 terminase large subunit [Clostridium indicum]
MKKYPLTYNPILEYWEEINSGSEIVSDKVKRTYKKVVYDIHNPGEYFYSPKRANHIIEFFENYCHHSKGKAGGQKVVLELWEKAMLATVFGFIDINGLRKYHESLLIVGKKNGKSLIASGVGLYMLVGDGEQGPEVYATATKKDQSKIIWLESKRMVKKSPALLRRIKPLVAELSSEDFNAGVFKPLASDSDTLDGLNVHCGLMDEIHQWKNGKALYDIIADGVTAREQPLIFITSTAGTVREDIYDQKYEEAERLINGYFDENGYKDEHFIAFIYELDNRKEWINEKCWKKANPGLGTIKNRATLKAKVEKAMQNPSLVKNLVCKEFNIRETSSEAWLTFEQINNTELFEVKNLRPRYGIGGCDLSSTTDLTNATVIFRVPDNDMIYVLQMYWLPEDLLERRVKEDKIPYDIWASKGLLRTCPGNKVHYKFVKEWYEEIQNEYDIYLFKCGYDSWSATYFVEDMVNTFGKSVMEPIIQGKKTLSSPMKSLGADLDKKKIIYNNNPILKWCLTNTSVDIDKNNNIQPCKGNLGTRRIDGLAGLLDAYVVYENHLEEYLSMI